MMNASLKLQRCCRVCTGAGPYNGRANLSITDDRVPGCLAACSHDECEERLAFFDDIDGELRRLNAADVYRIGSSAIPAWKARQRTTRASRDQYFQRHLSLNRAASRSQQLCIGACRRKCRRPPAHCSQAVLVLPDVVERVVHEPEPT